MTGKIFISYRRKDSRKDALLVFNRLVADFGRERVCMDMHDIFPGDNFMEVLNRELRSAKVLLALIGPEWLDARDEDGRRKLDSEHDFVRMEIRLALAREIRVIPLCLDGAQMPRPSDLPEDIRELANIHKLDVDVADLHAFMSAMRYLEEVIRDEWQIVTMPAVQVRAEPPVVSAHVPKPIPLVRAPVQTPSPPPKSIRPAWMHDEGRDIHGRWADLRVDKVIQRLRWIEPGEFWMGSTDAERRRFSEGASNAFKDSIQNEQPRHRVRLMQGFWLADTACTQELWQTLVGDNPSHFIGNLQFPVEKVSWDDITQNFLPALNDRLQGIDAALPTEAQWEYACRAGTETPYNLGELITPEQSNYDGMCPPPGGKKGLYREHTLPVKGLPPNAWGLHQMHGNVCEWCDDSLRIYTVAKVVDPVGPHEVVARALRGGAWDHDAAWVRSSYRREHHRSYGWHSFGFRFLLRSRAEGGGR